MTNADYIRQTLNDKDLSKLLCFSFSYTDSKFLLDCEHVFEYWACRNGHPTGNVVKPGKPLPSVWDWERTYSEETNTWSSTGRKQALSIEVWLSMQYDKSYWDKAIDWEKNR